MEDQEMNPNVKLIDAALDDELDAAQESRLYERLASDPGLRDMLRSAQAIRGAARAYHASMSPPAALGIALFSRLNIDLAEASTFPPAEEAVPTRRRFGYLPLIGALLILGGAIAFFLWRASINGTVGTNPSHLQVNDPAAASSPASNSSADRAGGQTANPATANGSGNASQGAPSPGSSATAIAPENKGSGSSATPTFARSRRIEHRSAAATTPSLPRHSAVRPGTHRVKQPAGKRLPKGNGSASSKIRRASGRNDLSDAAPPASTNNELAAAQFSAQPITPITPLTPVTPLATSKSATQAALLDDAPAAAAIPLREGDREIPGVPPGMLDGVSALHFRTDQSASKFSVRFRGFSMSSRPAATIDSRSAAAIEKNIAIAGIFNIDEEHAIGVEGGEEAFPQVYTGTDNSKGVRIEQNLLTPWFAAVYRYRPLWARMPAALSPFAAISAGATREFWPMTRLGLGLHYAPTPFIAIEAGLEGSILAYPFQSTWFTTRKLGVTYGLLVSF